MRFGYGEREIRKRGFLPHSLVSPLFQPERTSVMGRTLEAIPIDPVCATLRKYGRGKA
jgi:hypothetical protein